MQESLAIEAAPLSPLSVTLTQGLEDLLEEDLTFCWAESSSLSLSANANRSLQIKHVYRYTVFCTVQKGLCTNDVVGVRAVLRSLSPFGG